MGAGGIAVADEEEKGSVAAGEVGGGIEEFIL